MKALLTFAVLVWTISGAIAQDRVFESLRSGTPAVQLPGPGSLPMPHYGVKPGISSEETPREAWQLFLPDELPTGELVDELQGTKLPLGDYTAKTVYLTGNFVVTASAEIGHRAVLRPVRNDAAFRIIAEYPDSVAPPIEGSTSTFDRSSGLLIRAIRHAADGSTNIYARSITSTGPPAKAAGAINESNSAEVKVPGSLKVEVSTDTVYVTPVEFEEIKLRTRPGMLTGTQFAANIRHGTKLKSLWGGMRSGIVVEKFTDVLTRGDGGVPADPEEFTYEYTLTIFETDAAIRSKWSPSSSTAYKVLWTNTYKTRVK